MKDTLVVQAAVVYFVGGVVSTVVAVGIFEGCRWARERFRAAARLARHADAIARTR